MKEIDYDNLTDDDVRLLEVIGWEGRVVKHFKGNLYLVLNTRVEHSETGERMIVYKALYDECKIYTRPVKMFAECCSKEQFNEYGEKYRFSLITMRDLLNT